MSVNDAFGVVAAVCGDTTIAILGVDAALGKAQEGFAQKEKQRPPRENVPTNRSLTVPEGPVNHIAFSRCVSRAVAMICTTGLVHV